MRIVHLASEFSPIAKAGGLGDMVVGLCRELAHLGHEVHAIIPRYDTANLASLSQIKLEMPDFKSLEKGNFHANAMWEVDYGPCHLHLLEARHPAGYFHRGRIYGCEDDIPRFLYFARAALEYLKLKNEPIDILHLHDWHVAVCAALVRDLFHLPIRSILLTIHNIEHQGKCSAWDLDAIGCNSPEEKFQDPFQPENRNLLKGGIVYADAIVAVSPTYAKEILTPEMGFHLDPLLRKYKGKLSGILNGLDETLWDPGLDPHLPLPYTKESAPSTVAEAKEKAKAALQKQFGLSLKRRPWIGSICRLVEQKGPDLLEVGLRTCIEEGGTFLLLGSPSTPEIRSQFESATQENALIHFAFNEELAHQIYAALDFFLIPSLFEPCGLAQMIAMRYGTIPIARATGGLKDTIFDWENPAISIHQRNGFLFAEPTARELIATLSRAIHLFKKDPATIQSLRKKGMQTDFSWKKPARDYHKLYEKMTERALNRLALS